MALIRSIQLQLRLFFFTLQWSEDMVAFWQFTLSDLWHILIANVQRDYLHNIFHMNNTWNYLHRAVLHMLIVADVISKFKKFNATERSTAASQQAATGHCEPSISHPYTLTYYHLRLILTLSSHLRLYLPSDLFLSWLSAKTVCGFPFPRCVQHDQPISQPVSRCHLKKDWG